MRWAAALVHVFTALGAVCALLAAVAVSDKAWETVFFWLGVAFLIDGIDGTFARMAHVTERLPRFSGERLDLVIDYVTYVFVPVLAMLAGGYLQGALGIVLGAIILLSSLFHFSDIESKADDYSFVGFPAIWNIVAFYLFVFEVPPMASAALVSACAALTFARLKWVHPLRVKALRPLTIALTVIWSIAALVAVATGFAETGWLVKGVLLAVAIYGSGLAMLNPALRQA
jgi:phosphatidylcholine synthase